jgi:hypothetical protein
MPGLQHLALAKHSPQDTPAASGETPTCGGGVRPAQPLRGCSNAQVHRAWLAKTFALILLAQTAAYTESRSPYETPLKYEEPKHLTASIYALGSESQRLLFKFERKATRSASTLNVERDFTYPDGRLAACEKAVYHGNDLVSYCLEERQSGAEGEATIRRDPGDPAKGIIRFEYSKEPRSGAKPHTHTESLRENTLVNDMVGPFLADHWDEIARGDKLRCRYIVVPRAETVGFTFSKSLDPSGEDGKAVIIKMEPTSRIIGALAEPLYFTVESAPPHHVLRYTGRTTPKLESAGKWRDLDAVTVFDWQ